MDSDWDFEAPDDRPIDKKMWRSGNETRHSLSYLDGMAMVLMTAADKAGQINLARISRDHSDLGFSRFRPAAIEVTMEWRTSIIGRTLR